jgi:hypothetical protein
VSVVARTRRRQRSGVLAGILALSRAPIVLAAWAVDAADIGAAWHDASITTSPGGDDVAVTAKGSWSNQCDTRDESDIGRR